MGMGFPTGMGIPWELELVTKLGMGMGRNEKSLMGIPWEWELVTKLGMGMGRNGNRLHGNGREWECKKPFPGISTCERLSSSSGYIVNKKRSSLDPHGQHAGLPA